MNRPEIIKALDEEIVRLHQVRNLLQGSQAMSPALAKLVSNGKSSHSSARRTISAEGRRRIAEAQRRRWAKQKHK
jgi:hypothetical protein